MNAEESRLIVQALADGEWTQKVVRCPMRAVYPACFRRSIELGLTNKDGWKQPMAPPPQPPASRRPILPRS